MHDPIRQGEKPLNFGIAIFAPVSAVRGSAVVQITQPLFVGEVIAAPLLISLAETFLLIANQWFHLEGIPIIDANLGQKIQMPISELRSLLHGIGNGVSNEAISPLLGGSATPRGVEPERGFLTELSPQAPMVVGLTIYADYTEVPYSPTTQFIVPIFDVPALTGAIPMLILTLLITIFVRAVVPPEASGAKPFPLSMLDDLKQKAISMTPEALVNLLGHFGKYFRQ